MNNFSKITNRLMSRGGIYNTPFLNFEYTLNTEPPGHNEPDIETLEGHIGEAEEKIQNLLKEKEDINKRAFTEILSEEENDNLSNIFNQIHKLESKIKIIGKVIGNLRQTSPESFFRK